MHRASPALLVLATCLAASVMTAAPVTAEDSTPPSASGEIPPPVLLAPSAEGQDRSAPDAPADAPASTASPSAAEGSGPAPSPFGSEPSPFGAEPSPFSTESAEDRTDTLLSVNVAMPGEVAETPHPSVRPPRMRLPLRKGHYGAKVARLHERLAWLGYDTVAGNSARSAFGRSTKAAVKEFQAKNWLPTTGKVNKTTWRKLRKQAGTVGELPTQCTEVKKSLCIDKTSRTLRFVVKGKVKATTDARFGQPGMETDEGVFAVKEKSYNHTSTLYGSWMPRAMFFNGDEAVHYSPDFARYGYLHGSHGCVGVRDMDLATRLFEKVPVGTRVYVYWS